MFDIGWPELMVVAVIALLVVGPKDLPKAIYGVGKWVRKARMVAREFQTHLDDMMREAELDDLKKQARDFNVTRELEKAVDPDGKMKTALDLPPADTATPGTRAPDTVVAEKAMTDSGAANAKTDGPAARPLEETQRQTATEPPVTAEREAVSAAASPMPAPQPPATPDKTA